MCCAKCRRGTPALGEFPCGLDGFCQCHQGQRYRCAGCGATWPTRGAADACEQVHDLEADVDMSAWGEL